MTQILGMISSKGRLEVQDLILKAVWIRSILRMISFRSYNEKRDSTSEQILKYPPNAFLIYRVEGMVDIWVAGVSRFLVQRKNTIFSFKHQMEPHKKVQYQISDKISHI